MKNCPLCVGYKKKEDIHLLIESCLKDKYDNIANAYHKRIFEQFLRTRTFLNLKENLIYSQNLEYLTNYYEKMQNFKFLPILFDHYKNYSQTPKSILDKPQIKILKYYDAKLKIKRQKFKLPDKKSSIQFSTMLKDISYKEYTLQLVQNKSLDTLQIILNSQILKEIPYQQQKPSIFQQVQQTNPNIDYLSPIVNKHFVKKQLQPLKQLDQKKQASKLNTLKKQNIEKLDMYQAQLPKTMNLKKLQPIKLTYSKSTVQKQQQNLVKKNYFQKDNQPKSQQHTTYKSSMTSSTRLQSKIQLLS